MHRPTQVAWHPSDCLLRYSPKFRGFGLQGSAKEVVRVHQQSLEKGSAARRSNCSGTEAHVNHEALTRIPYVGSSIPCLCLHEQVCLRASRTI